MFTQLFGHYLLNKNYINAEQLQKALEAKNETRVKLGALAIDAGYMTAEQVEKVHEEQKRLDKRIGDIAVSMGYLTEAQVDELLSKQKTANIVIGQTLMDLGYMTNADFEKALSEYKANAGFTGENNDEAGLAESISAVFSLDDMDNKDYYIEYLLLFVRNMVRFIGDDFAFAGCVRNPETKNAYLCSQDIKGAINAYTAIGGDKNAFYALASRYAGEEISDDEFAEACAGEFLNLQNGLFAVNLSNTQNTELDLTPQISERDVTLNMDDGIQVSLTFSFGTLNVTIAINKA